jgi:hypothetical protein
MSHFALTWDPDPARRALFLSAARTALASLPGMSVASAEKGPLALAWSYGPQTPLSVETAPDAFSLLMGYAVTEAGEHLDGRRQLELAVSNSPELDTLDGYFLSLLLTPAGGLTVRCDPLGLFPVYSSVRGEVLIVASNPGGCLAHPACPNRLDVRGLGGILLVNGLIEERTLIEGVGRLQAGHALEWRPGRGLHERELFTFTPEDTWIHRADEELLEISEQLIRESIRRHRPPGAATALLLSGGLDSRLMAASLSTEGVSYTPFT